MLQKQLFLAFFRSGIVGFGGGNATIPLIKGEVVERYHMLTEEEFYEIMAIGNTLPGPIITKMAGYIGYRVGGVIGLLNAIIAATMPSIVMLIVLFNMIYKIKNPGIIQGMMHGILPVICVMMLMTFFDCLKKSNQFFGKWRAIIAVVFGFVSIVVFHLDATLAICGVIIVALLLPVKKGNKVS